MESSKIRNIFITMILAAICLIIMTGTALAATATRNGRVYTHPANSYDSNKQLFDGIDVSAWQGSINWSKVKTGSGTDFALIRCGFTSLSTFKTYQDSRFVEYANGAKANNLAIGFYYYSNCATIAEAKTEANFVVNMIKKNGFTPQQPVIMDYEFGQGRLPAKWNSWVKSGGIKYARKRMSNNVIEFMNVIRAAGYTPMFYSYISISDIVNNPASCKVNMDDIQKSGYSDLWMAQYYSKLQYSLPVNYWQYSSTGSISGIKGSVDRNFWYYNKKGSGTHPGTKSIRKAKATLTYSQMKVTGSPVINGVTVKYGTKKLTENKDYVLSYMNNVKKGTACVILKGIGAYSNDICLSYKVGTANVKTAVEPKPEPKPEQKPQTEEEKINAPNNKEVTSKSPAQVKVSSTVVNCDTNEQTITFKKVSGATDYTLGYRLDDAKWKYVSTKKQLTYTLKVKDNVRVATVVRAEKKVNSKTTYHGKWSKAYYRVMADKDLKASLDQTAANVTFSWDPNKQGAYLLTYKAGDGQSQLINTASAFATVQTQPDTVYTASCTPYTTVNDINYVGASGDSTTVFASATKVSKWTRKGLKSRYVRITWDKKNCAGYKVKWSLKKNMKLAKTKNIKDPKTNTLVIKGKKATVYYVTITPYTVVDGKTLYGQTSPVKAVKTKK